MAASWHSFQRAKAIAFWTAPPLLALLLYYPGLTAWFQADDFAWLGLRQLIHGWRDFWRVMFAPLAQGTIRPLSERAFFLTFYSLFGLNALPYRGLAFLTHAATLTILSSVCTRLTSSRSAGFWAAILWTVNSALAVALSWTAIYYELLCSFFLLLSFWLLLRYVETGQRRFYIAQWCTFIVGFGVLELNVVYPALATVYALCCAPRILGKVLPLFLPSAAYTALHMAVAPLLATGPYKMHWDSSVISTLWDYWKTAMGPSLVVVIAVPPSWLLSTLTLLLTSGLISFLVWKLRFGQRVVIFFPAWFLIVLAPTLPLRDHISDYYLTIPLIGLAMWGGWALVSSWRSGLAGRIAGLSLLAIYVCVSVPVARTNTSYYHERSSQARKLVEGVANLSRRQPGKLVLLTGVSTDMFWAAINDRPLGLFGIREVYLLNENKSILAGERELGMFFLDPALEKRALEQNRAEVYDVRAGLVRDVTDQYRPSALGEKSSEALAVVDVGNNLVADQLGPTWYKNESGVRWMPKRATVKLRGPRGPEQKLYVTGFCPAGAVKAGPLQMQISVDGEKLAPVSIQTAESQFSFAFKLPSQMIGRPVVEVAVELDRTFSAPPDSRVLGLPFRSFEIR